ncbi:ROK family transcriptional regulator [Kribbella sandramycini]|uniref:Putative NBD/HSP70 family sugar kinase n=1 Tax=Kribbella sandramycini TaxID=60450 RepID=A0A7Y4KX24_9ACTN|nr:ROK family transcriptional regulator [Kribbella sandramycini]MBB6569948.1 putative NBD/HSP70 family sugar kinase [Kribbella sandramycini]NOL40228.1 ROK family transcriptional regulator [Kribbella sandramycini]
MSEALAGGDLQRLRQLNAVAVLRILRGDQPLTLTELAKRTGLSRASTEDVVRDLLGRGWVSEVEPAPGTVGRPARRYRFRADAGRLLGVDVGGHKVLAAVTDLEGDVLHQTRVPVAPDAGRRQRLAAIDDCITAALSGAGVTAEQIWSTGVATTGLVDGTGKVMLSDSLPEWTGVDLTAHLRRLVNSPIRVENDCKLAALAENWRGVARYAKDVVFLLAGLRTGAGLIIDGKLHRGFANSAGEIGALPAAGWERAPEHLHGWLTPGAEVEQVFLAARDGDRAAQRAVRGYVRDIAIGTSALVLTLDPELVVIGGGFSRSADVMVEPLRRELDRWCLRTPEIRVSAFADEGVALGAVRLALEQVESTLYGNSPATPALFAAHRR